MHPTPTLPLLRGGGKIILVSSRTRGGTKGGEFDESKISIIDRHRAEIDRIIVSHQTDNWKGEGVLRDKI